MTREQRLKLPAPRRERDQQRRPQRRPKEDERHRRKLAHGDPDHQVGDPPDDAHCCEEQRAATAHPESGVSVSILTTYNAATTVMVRSFARHHWQMAPIGPSCAQSR